MFDLSVLEAIVLALAVAAHGAAGAVAALQLAGSRRRCGALLAPLVVTAVVLDATVLGLRATSIGAIPLTGLFESLLVLALVFGVLYLLLRSAVKQVWFGSVMVWVILGVILTAMFAARPASRPQAMATTPWAIAHATAMILASAAVVSAAANSTLYLLGSYRLKHNRIMQVLGRIPNMETLGRMNRLGVQVGFVLLTMGIIGGLGLVSAQGTGIARWLTDGKVVCIIGAWGLLGAAVVLDRLHSLKVKARAYLTLVAFGLLLLAMIGVTVAGATRHKFSQDCAAVARTLTG